VHLYEVFEEPSLTNILSSSYLPLACPDFFANLEAQGFQTLGTYEAVVPIRRVLPQILKFVSYVASFSSGMKYNIAGHNCVYGRFLQSTLLSQNPEFLT
jgi:hypothetical protein